jgi:hypothetical protein
LAVSASKWLRGRIDNRVPRSAEESGRAGRGPAGGPSDRISLNVPAAAARSVRAWRIGRKFGRPATCVLQSALELVIGQTSPRAQDNVQVLLECSDRRHDHHFRDRRAARIGRGPADVLVQATSPASAPAQALAAVEFNYPLAQAKVVAEFNVPLGQVKVAAASDLTDPAAPTDPEDPAKTVAAFGPVDPTADRIVLVALVKMAVAFGPVDLTVAPIAPAIAGPTSPIGQSSGAAIVLGDPVTGLVPAAIGGHRGMAAKIVRGARMAMAIGDGTTMIMAIIGTTIGTIIGTNIMSITITTTGTTAVGATTGRTTGMCQPLLALPRGASAPRRAPGTAASITIRTTRNQWRPRRPRTTTTIRSPLRSTIMVSSTASRITASSM